VLPYGLHLPHKRQKISVPVISLIKSFKHKGLEKFFLNGTLKGIQAKHAEKLSDILDLLDAADTVQVLNFPGSRLHQLLPKNEKVWAVNVSGNWRVTFEFRNGDAYKVDYTDYH
jgi:proteic killer suppression protein